jgi:putative ABC transport system ATP-binding protein
MIRTKGLKKDYVTAAGAFHALRGVDVEIGQGEFVAVMGPSGSGKSTFMNLLGCLDKPSAGQYHLAGRPVSEMRSDELAQIRNKLIGFVFQGFNLLPRQSVLDNVALPMLYAGAGRSQRRHHAQELLDRVGLKDKAHQMPSQLSGGQQQRVAIARALVNKPRLILADEPTGNLDSKTSHEVMKLFADLNRDEGITLVLVTHEADIAAFSRRRISFLDGKVVEDSGAEA